VAQETPIVTPDPAPNWMIDDILETIRPLNLHTHFCSDKPDVRVQIEDESTIHHTAEHDIIHTPLNGSKIHPLPVPGEQPIPTLRMMHRVAFQVSHPTKPFRIHVNGGSN
jgi:hypothetical protein